MKNIVLPDEVNKVIEKLNLFGFEAYAVGGCIRDLLMGKTPVDWDITTSALPEQVKKVFGRTIDTGIQHGTVTVLYKKIPFEITTYRIDGTYENHRSPKDVEFTRDLIEDLRRRDFTMNAMAYNEKDGLVDVFLGREAIINKQIICVGDPSQRFEEDALRMLRAIRFSAQLGFEIDKETQKAIDQKAGSIKNISGERIKIELTKILLSDHPHYIEKLVFHGLMAYIIPEFMKNVGVSQDNKHHIYTIDQHTYHALTYIEPTETLRWTMFLHDIGKAETKTIDKKGIGHFYGHTEKSLMIAKDVLERLKFDNKTTADILKLIRYHDYRFEPTLKTVRKALSIIGKELFPLYTQVQKADIQAQNPMDQKAKLLKLEKVILYSKEIIKTNQCISLKDLKITGKDLLSIGLKQGQIIGDTLKQLLEMVIEEPANNHKEWLLEKARELNKTNK